MAKRKKAGPIGPKYKVIDDFIVKDEAAKAYLAQVDAFVASNKAGSGLEGYAGSDPTANAIIIGLLLRLHLRQSKATLTELRHKLSSTPPTRAEETKRKQTDFLDIYNAEFSKHGKHDRSILKAQERCGISLATARRYAKKLGIARNGK